MSNVVRFPEPKTGEGDTNWKSGKATCLLCGHEWVAVQETGGYYMDCPQCGTSHGVMMGGCLPEDGVPLWVCNCGSHALYATENALRCCKCGSLQKPFD